VNKYQNIRQRWATAPAAYYYNAARMPPLNVTVRELPPRTNTSKTAWPSFEQTLTATATPASEIVSGGAAVANQRFLSRFVGAIAGAVVAGANFVPEFRRNVILGSPDVYTYNVFAEHVLTLAEARELARQIYDAVEARRERFFAEEDARDEALVKMYDL
jgi:hypothetical protein